MAHAGRAFTGAAAIVVLTVGGMVAHGQSKVVTPPYRIIENWAQLPSGLVLGAVPGVQIGPDGNIYVFHRCGADTCTGSNMPAILKFDPSGKLLQSWGQSMFVWPHGNHIDRDGNVWVADARGAGGKGNQVFKFSPDGKLLLTLGKAGVGGKGPDTFNGPMDIVTAPNGDIFVTDGHSCGGKNTVDCTNRVVKFSKDGKFIKTWGQAGSQPGEFNTPHSIGIDSRGRLIVCDRFNHRIQVFDQDGRLLDQWKGFGDPTGIFITKDDAMYVVDSLAGLNQGKGDQRFPNLPTGLYMGSAKDGSVKWFIPDEFLGPEDITVDARGDLYVGEARPQTVRKFVLDPARLNLGAIELRAK